MYLRGLTGESNICRVKSVNADVQPPAVVMVLRQ